MGREATMVAFVLEQHQSGRAKARGRYTFILQPQSATDFHALPGDKLAIV